MEINGVQTQVLSHVPAHDRDWTAAECRIINDYLYKKCNEFPGRFVGFATLPMHDPDTAILELERCIRELHFVGSLVDNTTVDGSFYDSAAYRPLLAKHVELDVPIYLHPTYASAAAKSALFESESASPVASFMIGGPGFGWHAGVGVHFLRLFASGVFDELPDLKLVLGHCGELLPFNWARTARLPASMWNVQREFKDVWSSNVWVTTSGMFTFGPLQCLLEVTSKDRVMFSIDYPFSTNEMGKEFMDRLKTSGLVTPEEWEGIGGDNARRLLKLDHRL
jgi:predicted TIM-barrel fold metal-dependent hydrolase